MSPTFTLSGTADPATVVTNPSKYSPYPSVGGTSMVFLSPSFNPTKPFSNPGIRLPFPKTVFKGARPSCNEESNTWPSSNLPV